MSIVALFIQLMEYLKHVRQIHSQKPPTEPMPTIQPTH